MRRNNIKALTFDKVKYKVTLNQAYSIKDLLARYQSGLPLPNLQQRYSVAIDENDANPDPLSENVDLTDVYKLLRDQHNKRVEALRQQRKKYNQPPQHHEPPQNSSVNEAPPTE